MASYFTTPAITGNPDPWSDWDTPAKAAAAGANVVIDEIPASELVAVNYSPVSPTGAVIETKRTGRWRCIWMAYGEAQTLINYLNAMTAARTVYGYDGQGNVVSASNQLLPCYTCSSSRNPNGTYDVVISAVLRDWALTNNS